MPSGNGRKRDNAYFNFNSEEAVRSRNMAATQNFLDRLRDAGHDPDEVFASSVVRAARDIGIVPRASGNPGATARSSWVPAVARTKGV